MNILLLTNQFPFDNGETFLETELAYLNNVANLTILPYNSSNYSRKIANDIQVLNFKKNKPIEFKIFLKFGLVLFFELISNLRNLTNIRTLFRSYITSIKIYSSIKFYISTNKIKTNKLLIYSYWFDNSTIAALFIKKDFPSIKVITRVHGADLYKERQVNNYLPFRKFSYKSIDKIFCISKNGLSYLVNNHPYLKSKTHISYLGINNTNINNFIISPEFTIVSCSHINPVKRIDLLINAVSKLNIKFKWTHIGYGFDFNEKPIKELATKCLDDSIYEFIGEIANKEVLSLYNKSNFSVFVNVSSSEGLPVSMMEAMSCGIPCIGTDVGGVSEIIEDGINGFLLNHNPTEREVAEVILKYRELSDTNKNKMKTNAFRTWKTKFNAEKNYSEFIEELLFY